MFNYFMSAMRKYATFQGRSRRKEYWYFTLVTILAIYAIAFLAGFSGQTWMFGLLFAFYFAILIPALAVSVRRMHDVGKSGWFILIPIYSLILACTDSQPGTNKYGPNPKNNELDVADHLID